MDAFVSSDLCKAVTRDAGISIAGRWHGSSPGSILDKDCLL